jgi:hypothetical protein
MFELLTATAHFGEGALIKRPPILLPNAILVRSPTRSIAIIRTLISLMRAPVAIMRTLTAVRLAQCGAGTVTPHSPQPNQPCTAARLRVRQEPLGPPS